MHDLEEEPRTIVDEREWLAQQFESLTTELEVLSPSEWAEKKRYLPPAATSLPGYYRFEVAPYLREILDCLGVDSPIREVSLMKGVQIGATVGVIENLIGYLIDHVKSAPVMMVTADAELALLRLESYILPMINFSGLDHLIQSADEKNARKSGKTNKKLEWRGGGFLIPFGAQNANKLRSISIQVLLQDEIDGWPLVVGKDGDPLKLARDRTAAYEQSRKILELSTPLVKGTSKIAERFEAGDKRRYFVCCLKCGHSQALRWHGTDPDSGAVYGITWDSDAAGNLVPETTRYLCKNCGHAHTNDDKTRLLAPENGAEWRPTKVPASPHHRSYHLNALYSPVGMQSWEACVAKWLEAWDPARNQPKDAGKLQVFYNNVLGEPFEVRGEKLRFSRVSPHRRGCYRYGEIPNKWLLEHCGSRVLLLTCSVDVHKDNLAVSVFGWCRDRRAVLIDYWRFEGNTEQLDDASTWGRLRELIEGEGYTADDGCRYPRLQLTLIDAGYRADTVYQFAASFEAGVFPVKGRTQSPNAAIREFSEFTTPMGTRAFGITVDLYKDRWSAALRRGWDGHSLQPTGHFNAPANATDKQLKELTVEVKRERIEKGTGKRLGFEWHRPGGANNELWDLLVYANAALDLLAWEVCRNNIELEAVNWTAFWDLLQEQKPYYLDPT